MSEIAAGVERAADEGDRESIEASLPRLIAKHGEAASAIALFIPQPDGLSPEGDEIMEFLPE